MLPTGCLSGDTIVRVNNQGCCRKYTLENLYKVYQKKKRPYKIRSYKRDADSIGLNDFDNIVYCGIKELYLLELENGMSLKCTKDHKIMTASGLISLLDCKIGENVAIDEAIIPRKKEKKKKKLHDSFKYVSKNHPYAKKIISKGYLSYRIEKHRFVYEAHINEISQDEYRKKLRSGQTSDLKFINPSVFHIHHIDGNHHNNDISNLVHIEKEKHQQLHGDYKNFSQGIISYSKVKRISFFSVDNTYDIVSVENGGIFCANDILVSNSGKTFIFSELLNNYVEKYKINALVIVNKIILAEQADKYFDNASFYCASLKEKKFDRVTIASWQSIKKCKDIPMVNIVIVDEVHRYGDNLQKFLVQIFEKRPQAKVIGFTATPFDNNNYIYGEGKFFKKPCYQMTLKDLTPEYLVPLIYKSQSKECEIDLSDVKKKGGDFIESQLSAKFLKYKDKVNKQIEHALSKSVGRKKIIVLTTSIEHADYIASQIDCIVYHSKRKDNIESEWRIMVSVLVASEGFDYPPADCLWLMRPTRSIVLYIQAAGRILRKFHGKENGLLLDYGGTVSALGDIYEVKPDGKKKSNMKICEACDAIVKTSVTKCECGNVFYTNCEFCLEMKPLGEPCQCGKTKEREHSVKNTTETDNQLQTIEIRIDIIIKKSKIGKDFFLIKGGGFIKTYYFSVFSINDFCKIFSVPFMEFVSMGTLQDVAKKFSGRVFKLEYKKQGGYDRLVRAIETNNIFKR